MKSRRQDSRRRQLSELPELVTPEEARAFLRVSRNVMYELIRSQRIASIRLGRSIRIPRTALGS
jgi:excisionase family DNA binding protein